MTSQTTGPIDPPRSDSASMIRSRASYIETLASFFKRGGLEVWLRFAGFNVDAETIIAGLETVTAIKPKIGHLLKDEHEQSGNYFVDMKWRTN